MDNTLDNIDLLQKIIFKTPFQLNINHTEDPDLSFIIDVDKLDITITEGTIFITIKK